MDFLNRINAFLEHTNSQYKEERRQILEVIEDDEPGAWKSFTARLSITSQTPTVFYLTALEAKIEHAAKDVFDSSFCDDSARDSLIQFYVTVYQVIGLNTDEAIQKASSLVDSQCLGRLLNFKI